MPAKLVPAKAGSGHPASELNSWIPSPLSRGLKTTDDGNDEIKVVQSFLRQIKCLRYVLNRDAGFSTAAGVRRIGRTQRATLGNPCFMIATK